MDPQLMLELRKPRYILFTSRFFAKSSTEGDFVIDEAEYVLCAARKRSMLPQQGFHGNPLTQKPPLPLFDDPRFFMRERRINLSLKSQRRWCIGLTLNS